MVTSLVTVWLKRVFSLTLPGFYDKLTEGQAQHAYRPVWPMILILQITFLVTAFLWVYHCKKVMAQVEESKTRGLGRMLFGIGMRHVGANVAELLT